MQKKVRSIFVSDVHLGCRYSKAKELTFFIDKFGHELENLFIVGDFVDGWKLSRKWYWRDDFNFLFRKILGLVKNNGTQIHYLPGNHDEFLRKYQLNSYGSIHITNEMIYETKDGFRYLIIHGDQFDFFINKAKLITKIGDNCYNLVMHINEANNFIRKILKLKHWSLSKFVKTTVKEATKYINNFEEVVSGYAKKQGCDGVICGHIHTPVIKDVYGIRYCNTGDWMENCSAIVEHIDGRLEMFEDQNNIYVDEEISRVPPDQKDGNRVLHTDFFCDGISTS